MPTSTRLMAARALDRRIELLQWSDVTSTFVIAHTVWAELVEKPKAMHGLWEVLQNQRFVSQREQIKATAAYRIQYRAGLNPAWRVRDGGVQWDVKAVQHGAGRGRETFLFVAPASDYTADHAAALAEIREAGAAVTFTKTTYLEDLATGTQTRSEASVAGYAAEMPGDPEQYERLHLTEKEAPTLLFVSTTLGDVPESDAEVTWRGRVHTVREILPLAPAGTPIRFRIVIGRP